MPTIAELRNYPVAGMEGQAVSKLTLTPTAIVGNRVFAVVLEEELEKLVADPNYVPLRLTQVTDGKQTKLVNFTAVSKKTHLEILHQKQVCIINHTSTVEPPSRPFYQGESVASVKEAVNNFTLPFRVSKKSSSSRWAEDCGQAVATWLSERMGQAVRLVKAVRHPTAQKHHFTWYTDVHAITQASLQALVEETGSNVDPLTFRYNIFLTDTEPYAELKWQQVELGGVPATVKPCQRCGYIGIDRATGKLAQHMEVLHTVSKQHDLKFGVYLQPQGDDYRVELKVGDEITVTKKASSA